MDSIFTVPFDAIIKSDSIWKLGGIVLIVLILAIAYVAVKWGSKTDMFVKQTGAESIVQTTYSGMFADMQKQINSISSNFEEFKKEAKQELEEVKRQLAIVTIENETNKGRIVELTRELKEKTAIIESYQKTNTTSFSDVNSRVDELSNS